MRVQKSRVLVLCLLVSLATAQGDESSHRGWRASTLQFGVLAVASAGSSIWACGTNEGIAVSTDGGAHWQSKHFRPNGNLLFTVQFVNGRFGYATGTRGLILITQNGGETWDAHSAGNAPVLQASFSDAQHGLIRIPDSLEFTADGGSNWSAVSVASDPDVLERFPYTFSLVSLDPDHMAVMLKEGPAQYFSQTFLVTDDGGKAWRVVNIPSVTLYSFLGVRGRYWAVGTEVIDKDKPGGGHAVPVALYSSDGVAWSHSSNDLSGCGPEMCVACTPQGCLSANGTISDIFGEGTNYRTFPSDRGLTTKWAATDSAVCVAGKVVRCSALVAVAKPSPGDGPVPAVLAPPPLTAPQTRQPPRLPASPSKS